MSSIEAVVKFFADYPAWAKWLMLAGLVITFGTAILAPRSPIDAEAQQKPEDTRPTLQGASTFKIQGVSSVTLPPKAMVRVTAIVNGKSHTYPSLAGVDWLDVGPTMSPQSFSVPTAQRYEVRFEMEVKTPGSGSPRRYVSQETVQISTLPHTAEYRLYPVRLEGESVTRAAIPGATVRYSIE